MWKLLDQISLLNNWQFTDPVEGSVFRIKHSVIETDERRLKLTQRYKKGFITFGYIENNQSVTIANPKQEFVYGREIEIFIFAFPSGIFEPRLFVKKIDSAVANTWIIEISEFMEITVTISEVEGLQTALDGKAPTVHNHGISDVTGLQTALDAKAIASEVETALAGLQTALNEKAIASEVETALAGLQTALNEKAIASDVQTSLAGLQTALDAKAIAADVTTALAGKSNVGHGHQIADIQGLTALLQSIQLVDNIIDSASVPSNPFDGLVWNELTGTGELVERWSYRNSQWRSLTIYKIDYFGPSSAIAGTASYQLPLDDRYNYFFKDYFYHCIYNTGTVDSTTNYYRVIFTTQPSGSTFANSGAIANDNLSKRITLNQAFNPAAGERLILNPQKIGAAPNAKIAISLTYQLVRK